MEFNFEKKASTSNCFDNSCSKNFDLMRRSTEFTEKRTDTIDSTKSQSLETLLSQIKLGDCGTKDSLYNASPDKTISKPGAKNERITKLKNSLNGIQSNVELKRSSILEDIYQKMNSLESKIANGEKLATQLYSKTGERINNVEKSISSVGLQQENLLKDKISALESLHQKFGEALANEKENCKRAEREAMVEINRRICAIKDDITDLQKSKAEVSANLKKYLENELPQIKAKLLNCNEQIKCMEAKILEKTSGDLVTLASFLKHENAHIDNVHKAISQELAKGVEKLKAQVQKECDERRNSHACLTTLMEETLRRLGSPL